MRRALLILLVACKGQQPAPAPGSGSAPPVVVAPKAPFGPTVGPPEELAELRQGMSFDQAARIAPKVMTSQTVDTTIAGMKTHITFFHDELDRIDLTVPAGTDAMLAKQWGPSQWWLDPTTGWFASYNKDDSTLSFKNHLPDPDQMTKGAAILDEAMRTLADAKHQVPKEALGLGSQSNPFKLSSLDRRVLLDMPIMSHRAQLSSWLALLAQRWGAAKPTTPGHWTYAAPVKVDAHISDLGDLELDLAPPS